MMNCETTTHAVLSNGPSAGRPIRMFLADGSSLAMGMLARLLMRNRDIRIIGSSFDGWTALSKMRTLRPDLVLVDMDMPGLDGAEVARRLKQRTDPPVVFVVASDYSPEEWDRALSSGADAFLAKNADLPAQLRMATEQWFGPRPVVERNTLF